MIAIQCIETWWTKASRGEPGASARAASPDALTLPPATGSGEVTLHRVVLDERAGFEARSSVVVMSLQETQRRLGGLVLHAGLDVLDVMFTWSPYTVGAPERRNGQAIRLHGGSWCRILHNGRMSDEQEWSYQQTVFNIALHPSTPALFLDSEPLRIDDHRAALR
ncbi:MAG: hypothetical protein K0Q76_3852 [Panacagrimonas sp.]|jgi:hypothetical protein|nr:hypothetical protein [Panacagrimonas sp.]MCC2658744.1 hypothetical protein [Panacagrimonas sp.]